MLAHALVLAYDAQETLSRKTKIGFMPSGSFIILNWVTLGVSTLLLLADVYLVSYHVMLICKNTTTYRYIRAQQKI